MFAKVSYDDASGRTKKLQLRAGQCLSIGASFSADIVLNNSVGVASEHAEILFKHQKCSIKNLTGKPDKLLVNGQPTKATDLANGDAIEIGGNQMSIEIESGEPIQPPSRTATAVVAAPIAVAAASTSLTSDAAAESQTAPETTPADTMGPQFQRHPNGTAMITVDGFVELIHPIIEEAKLPWKYHLICNHQLSQLEGDPPSEQNYLATGPAKISDENDLHLVSFEDEDESRSEALKMYLKYAQNGAGLLGINGPDLADVDVADQLKFLATWFVVPASLKFHTTNGSSLLLNKVFGLFEMLVIPDVNTNLDLVILNDPAIDGFESLIDKIKGASHDLGN
jgi:hypothetical protein